VIDTSPNVSAEWVLKCDEMRLKGVAAVELESVEKGSQIFASGHHDDQAQSCWALCASYFYSAI
jgi:hypothetical protein